MITWQCQRAGLAVNGDALITVVAQTIKVIQPESQASLRRNHAASTILCT